jgi:porin
MAGSAVTEERSPVRTGFGRRYPPLLVAACAAAALASAANIPAFAQEAAQGGAYGGPLRDRSTLIGDWGGVRDDLSAWGITVLPSLTGFYEGPTAGNVDHTFDLGAKGEVLLNVDGGKLGLWDGFGVRVHGEYNVGTTPGEVGGTTIPNSTAMTYPVQNQPGGDFSSVYVTQRFGPSFTLLAGKTNMFDFYASGHKFSGGRGVGLFWNTAFVGPPSGIVPVAAFGAMGVYKVNPLSFTLMVYDPTDALNYTGFESPFSAGVTLRGSMDVSSNLLGVPRTDSFMAAISSEKGTDFESLPDLSKFANPAFRAALIKAFITQALWGQDAENYLPPELRAETTEKRGRWWVGYSFEQTLWQSQTEPSKSWGLFGQAAWSDGNPNSLQWSALGGIGGTSPLPGRLDDRFGVGVFYEGYSNILKRHLYPLITLGDEYGAEMFYNLAITKGFRLTADLQVIAPAIKAQTVEPAIVNPTVANNSTVVFVGLRGQVRF